MAGVFYNRFASPLIQLARQGVTPEMLALSLALGLCVSCFPVLGTTTILCTLIAFTWRLNLPAILLANWAALPLQMVFLIPLIQIGGRLFPSKHVAIPAAQLSVMLIAEPWHATKQLWTWPWHAVVAWMLVAPVACVLLTVILRIALRRLAIFGGPAAITDEPEMAIPAVEVDEGGDR
jgi:uncharacterized protein (DUF2062 family)